MNIDSDSSRFGSHSLQVLGDADREAVGLHVQRKGNLVRPGAHEAVVVLAIIIVQPLVSERTSPLIPAFLLYNYRVSPAFQRQWREKCDDNRRAVNMSAEKL
jgi:hypothetical protein